MRAFGLLARHRAKTGRDDVGYEAALVRDECDEGRGKCVDTENEIQEEQFDDERNVAHQLDVRTRELAQEEVVTAIGNADGRPDAEASDDPKHRQDQRQLEAGNDYWGNCQLSIPGWRRQSVQIDGNGGLYPKSLT